MAEVITSATYMTKQTSESFTSQGLQMKLLSFWIVFLLDWLRTISLLFKTLLMEDEGIDTYFYQVYFKLM